MSIHRDRVATSAFVHGRDVSAGTAIGGRHALIYYYSERRHRNAADIYLRYYEDGAMSSRWRDSIAAADARLATLRAAKNHAIVVHIGFIGLVFNVRNGKTSMPSRAKV